MIVVSLFALIALLSGDVALAEFKCPNRWMKSVVEGKCIQVFKFARTFEQARDWCKVFETMETSLADLISVHSPEENNQVNELAREMVGSAPFWIGMQMESGTLQWTDEYDYNYDNFDTKPSSVEKGCANVAASSKWNLTVDCEQKTFFACELFLGKPPVTTTRAPPSTPKPVPPQSDCRGYTSEKSGVKKIQLSDGRIVQTYCNIGTNNAYTVVQSRGEEDITEFNQTYSRYEVGFGDAGRHTNFWLGLENMRKLVGDDGKYVLTVELCCNKHPIVTTSYKQVKLLDKAHSYTLKALAADSIGLAFVNSLSDIDAPFSTYEDFRSGSMQNSACDVIDNSVAYGSVSKGSGGWWFGSCANNLNGHYYGSESDEYFVDKDTCLLDRDKMGRYGSGIEYRTDTSFSAFDGVFDGVSYTRSRISIYEEKYGVPEGAEALCD